MCRSLCFELREWPTHLLRGGGEFREHVPSAAALQKV